MNFDLRGTVKRRGRTSENRVAFGRVVESAVFFVRFLERRERGKSDAWVFGFAQVDHPHCGVETSAYLFPVEIWSAEEFNFR